MTDFPVSIAELSREWLSKALGCEVTGFEAAPLGEGVGLIGLVTRVELQSDTGPASVIAKFPSPIPENRAVGESYDMYGKEFRFYMTVVLRNSLEIVNANTCVECREHSSVKHSFISAQVALVNNALGPQSFTTKFKPFLVG